MPQRRNREPVWVSCIPRPGGTTSIAYGFNSGADSASRATLGQQSVDAAPVTIVFGANRPKPARVTKKTATGSESSFVAHTQEATARSAGWRLSGRRKYATPSSSGKMQLVCVTTSGIEYAWMMDKGDFAAFGSELGIRVVTNTMEVVVGASSPKPGRAAKIVAGTGDSGIRSTGSFFEDGQELGEGWSIVTSATPAAY